MPHYSLATTRDELSDLIDRALAGEEVILTRDGKPTVALKVIDDSGRAARLAALDKLRALRESLPMMTTSFLDLKRMDEEDRAR